MGEWENGRMGECEAMKGGGASPSWGECEALKGGGASPSGVGIAIVLN